MPRYVLIAGLYASLLAWPAFADPSALQSQAQAGCPGGQLGGDEIGYVRPQQGAGGQLGGDEIGYVRPPQSGQTRSTAAGRLCPANRQCAALFDRVVSEAGQVDALTQAGGARAVTPKLANQIAALKQALGDIESFARQTDFTSDYWGRDLGVHDGWSAAFVRSRQELDRSIPGLGTGMPLTQATRDALVRISRDLRAVERGNCRT